MSITKATPVRKYNTNTKKNKRMSTKITETITTFCFFFPMALQPLGGLGRLIFRGFTITLFRHTTILWTRDQLVAETYA
jgi:hypothetical protein